MEVLIKIAISLSGMILGFVLHELYLRFSKNAAHISTRSILQKAEDDAKRILREADLRARSESLHRKEEADKDIKSRQKELLEMEKELRSREDALERREESLENDEKSLEFLKNKLLREEESLTKQEAELDRLFSKEISALEEVSELSIEQAEERLLQRLEKEVEEESARIIKRHMAHTKEQIAKNSRDILLLAVQRCAVEHTAESVVSTIDIPSDEMKGRIIGKEGRNIRSFEKTTGVNVIVDDTPGMVVVSGFDPIRREIARLAMEKLILDGRIHPTRIEEVVGNTRREIEGVIFEVGKQTAYEVGIQDLDPYQLQLIGRMKFQTTRGQNLLQHTLEVVHLSAIVAGELNLDVELAKRCALLHDIGRVVDHHHEGSHAEVGAEIAKRCKEIPLVVNAIAAHHDSVAPESPYAVLLQTAHAIAVNRPGAQKEALERHLKRLDRMEEIALSFDEIEHAYAVQSGREIRCIAKANSSITDARAVNLSYKIARKIEQELSYSGEIKVSLAVETRIVEYAR